RLAEDCPIIQGRQQIILGWPPKAALSVETDPRRIQVAHHISSWTMGTGGIAREWLTCLLAWDRRNLVARLKEILLVQDRPPSQGVAEVENHRGELDLLFLALHCVLDLVASGVVATEAVADRLAEGLHRRVGQPDRAPLPIGCAGYLVLLEL